MLPKIEYPLHNILIPSLEEKRKFRPYLTKEEKILLMADQSGDLLSIIESVKQVINNCYSDSKPLDIEQLSTFDLDYLFLKLRAISVNNIMKMSYKDSEDEKVRDFELDLNDLELTITENHTRLISLPDNIKIKMQYPRIEIMEKIKSLSETADILDEIIINCIDKIYDNENVYDEYNSEELKEWLESLPNDVLTQIRDFFNTMPKVYHKIEYKNDNGNNRIIELSSLEDFFIWR